MNSVNSKIFFSPNLEIYNCDLFLFLIYFQLLKMDTTIMIKIILIQLKVKLNYFFNLTFHNVLNKIFFLEKHIFSTDGKSKRAKTFEELYAKAEELKGKRSNYQDRCLKKNLKNKISKKVKREQRLMQKKLARTERASAETQKVKEDVDVPKIPKQKPIFNSQGNMVFSKFDFSEIGTKKKVQKIEKDPKKILHQLEEKKKKVKELEEVGEKDKAQEIKEKEAWKSVLAKASGEKVKY